MGLKHTLRIKASVLTRDIIKGHLPHDYPQVVTGEKVTSGPQRGRWRVHVIGHGVTWFSDREIEAACLA